LADQLIVAVAVANGLPLVNRNAADFAGLSNLLHIIKI
jgi:predicted nucleic acid-binding protein